MLFSENSGSQVKLAWQYNLVISEPPWNCPDKLKSCFVVQASGLTCVEESFGAVIMLPGTGYMERCPIVAVMGLHVSSLIDHELDTIWIPWYLQKKKQTQKITNSSCINLKSSAVEQMLAMQIGTFGILAAIIISIRGNSPFRCPSQCICNHVWRH